MSETAAPEPEKQEGAPSEPAHVSGETSRYDPPSPPPSAFIHDQDVIDLNQEIANGGLVIENGENGDSNGDEPPTKRRREGSPVAGVGGPATDPAEEKTRRAQLAQQVPVFSRESMEELPEQMIFRESDSSRSGCKFYQDGRRLYQFQCGPVGLTLLAALVERVAITLEKNAKCMGEVSEDQREHILAQGRELYVQKPSLRQTGRKSGINRNVTWSIEEYGHVGLQRQYLRLKSIQRFTETYNLCQRACQRDRHARKVVLKSDSKLRVASIGGGPGFELDAIREFVWRETRSLTDQSRFEFYSIDLQPDWKPYPESLGFNFVAPFDINSVNPEDLRSACDGKDIDVLVISYLLIYCTTERTADFFEQLLRQGIVKILFCSERTHKQDIVPMLVRRNLSVTHLMPQYDNQLDQRQLLVQLKESAEPTNARPEDIEEECVFVNVPFKKGS